jgi:hypothetical protein
MTTDRHGQTQERTRVVHQQMNMVEDFSHDAPSSELLPLRQRRIRRIRRGSRSRPSAEVGGEVVEKAFRLFGT